MTRNVDHLFVYGTLRPGSSAHARRILKSSAEHVGKGEVRSARMFDLGEYPGAVRTRSKREFIIGDVFRINKSKLSEVMEALDAYEEFDPSDPKGSLYVRKITNVKVEDTDLKAWIYWFNRPVEQAVPIEEGDYSRVAVRYATSRNARVSLPRRSKARVV